MRIGWPRSSNPCSGHPGVSNPWNIQTFQSWKQGKGRTEIMDMQLFFDILDVISLSLPFWFFSSELLFPHWCQMTSGHKRKEVASVSVLPEANPPNGRNIQAGVTPLPPSNSTAPLFSHLVKRRASAKWLCAICEHIASDHSQSYSLGKYLCTYIKIVIPQTFYRTYDLIAAFYTMSIEMTKLQFFACFRNNV